MTSNSPTRRHTQSADLFARACRRLVGGVNSPVRAFKAVGGNPVFVRRAAGARLWDVDGNEYIDLVGSWGPAVVGHAHVHDLDDVDVADAAGRLRLAVEPPHHLRVVGEFRTEGLDGDASVDQHVLRFVDGAHAAFADEADDAVFLAENGPEEAHDAAG